jgi:hypothetical protein
MVKYLRVTEKEELPENKQARELLLYAKEKAGNKKFAVREFNDHLEKKGPNTVLKDSKANPRLTFNYYRPGLLYYGHMEMYEDDQKLKINKPNTDPFYRKKTTTTKSMSPQDEKNHLEALVAKAQDRLEELDDIIRKQGDQPAGSNEDIATFGDTEEDSEPTDAELEAAPDEEPLTEWKDEDTTSASPV